MTQAVTTQAPTAETVPVDDRVFLARFLSPLQCWLDQDDVSEICINRPGEVWVEQRGTIGMQRVDVPALTERHLRQLAQQVAASTRQAINAESPLLSATLPGGERIQCVLPPCATAGGALSIRKQVVVDLSLDDYIEGGAFTDAVVTGTDTTDIVDSQLRQSLETGDIPAFLTRAIHAKKNLLISGGTSSGKTTFLNALAKEIPQHERLITLEDTPEVRLPQPNVLSLIAVKGDQGEARIGISDLLEASLRLRPDRILLGELRGAEAYTFLQAVNTGHPGSLTTLHANSPQGARERLALMVMQANLGLKREEILAYIETVIDIVIQLGRTPDGRRVVTAIDYPHKN